jgi:adenylate cyclase
VRLLYRTGREPVLGGELQPVTLLFSDIQDFTAISERLPPNDLAQVLGRYLETMAEAIQKAQGTIDKYIGDSIMAIWNAPSPCPNHARWACEAALSARAAGERLCRSPEWAGRPVLVTRFGLHSADVLVGHFGAPDRLSYTCLGDGVNLASRVEGLNKQYGTTILVSDAVRRAAGDEFTFRRIDLVAVKGRQEGALVHELRGRASETDAQAEPMRRYEEAFLAYLARDFGRALDLLDGQSSDPPSVVLAERCRLLRETPPGPGWSGVFVATHK